MGRLGLLVPVVEDDHAARVDGVTPGPREGGRDRDQVLSLEDAVVHKLHRVLVMVPPSVRRVHLAVERERPRRVVERPKHALAPGASCRVVLRYSPADPTTKLSQTRTS